MEELKMFDDEALNRHLHTEQEQEEQLDTESEKINVQDDLKKAAEEAAQEANDAARRLLAKLPK